MLSMFERSFRVLKAMELEEKVLHIGVVLCLTGLFFPWLNDSTQQWNGFGYHTGYIGHVTFLLQIVILAVTASPLFGGPIIVRRQNRHSVRLMLSCMALVLLLSAFTVLFRVSNELHGIEIRFGMHLALIGCALTTLYAFLKHQEEKRLQAQALFRHPDEPVIKPKPQASAFSDDRPPPPPPPAPPPPEEHALFTTRP